MKQNLLCLAATALLLSSCGGIVPEEELVINLQEKGAEVAPSMYGIFFEEINHAGDGGLYAELVKNRSFEELEMPEGYYAEEMYCIRRKFVTTCRVRCGKEVSAGLPSRCRAGL